jgi:sugar lactone lactonase YvrE
MFAGSKYIVKNIGTLGSNTGQFEHPLGIAIDNSGNFFVADTNNNRIQKFDNSGNFLATFGSAGSENGQFNKPSGIAVDNTGNFFVADTNNHRIQKFDNSGNFVLSFGKLGTDAGLFDSPVGITVDNSDNIFVVDTNNHRIQKFDGSGNFLDTLGSLGADNAQFNNPSGIAIDSSGNLFVVDTNNHRIQKFNNSGNFIDALGGIGTDDWSFNKPSGITIDNSGNIFIADTNNNRIQEFDSSGSFLNTFTGDADKKFNNPSSIAVDKNGNIFVVDTNNDRIQLIKIITLYSVNGYIKNTENIAMPNVILELKSNQSPTLATTSDNNGYYEFKDLEENNDYTLTPSSTLYFFNPTTLNLKNLKYNATDQNFIATKKTYSITGYVKSNTNQSLENINVNLTGNKTAQIKTNASGFYQFINLEMNCDYQVSAESNLYAFNPSTITITNLTTHASEQNFVAKKNTYSIAGYLRTKNNQGADNVVVNLSGAKTATMQTNPAGYYKFTDLEMNGDYVLTPDNTAYIFNPNIINVKNLTENTVVQNIIVNKYNYSISGYIKNLINMTPMSDIVVNLQGTNQRQFTKTTNTGYYQFTNLESNDTYTLTPESTSYLLNPQNINVSDLKANITDKNFLATNNTYNISGFIKTQDNQGLENINVNMSGSRSGNVKTDSEGYYEFGFLSVNTNYVLTPESTSYSFNPLNIPVNNLAYNIANPNIIATKKTYSISGYVKNKNDQVVPNITINLKGNQEESTTTNANGFYQFTNLEISGNFTLSAADNSEYYFKGVKLEVKNLNRDITNKNFMANKKYWKTSAIILLQIAFILSI